jgi:hypothetical protein
MSFSSPADQLRSSGHAWTNTFCRRSNEPHDEGEKKDEGDDGGAHFGAAYQA